MEDQTISIIAYIGSWVALIRGLDWLFNRDDHLKPEVKRPIVRLLKWIDETEINLKWQNQFIHLVDKIFGAKYFSLRSFKYSILCSISATCIVYLIVLSASTHVNSLFNRPRISIVVLMMIINIPVDYLSLTQTRLFLNWMTKAKRIWTYSGLLVADAVITALLGLGFFLGIFFLLGFILDDVLGDIILGASSITAPYFEWNQTTFSVNYTFLEALKGYMQYIMPPDYLLIALGRTQELFLAIIATTFFTSIWLWLYLLCGMLAKWKIGWILKPFDIEEKPYRSLGMIAQFIVTMGYLIAIPFVFF